MKAVVLAAGEGKRLRPLTKNMSKGMISAANRPILGYVIDALASNDIRDIIVVVGHQKEKVMNYLGDGKGVGVNIKYVEQKFQLGTAHALFQAREKVKGRFLLVPGDSLLDPKAIGDLLSIGTKHWGMLLSQASTNTKYGMVTVKGDTLVDIKEKPKLTDDLVSSGAPSILALALWDYRDPNQTGLINTGTYLLDDAIFPCIESRGAGERTTLISCLVNRAESVKVRITGNWLDAVYPWDLLALNEYALGSIAKSSNGTMEEGVVITGRVKLGKNVKIRANTVIQGPVVIGDNTEIGPGAYIAPNTSIGQNCIIQPFTVIRNSLIMDDVTMGAHSSVTNSVIGQGVEIGEFFSVEIGEYTIKLENFIAKKTLGAIVGPDCRISHHVNLGQGVILGADCRIGAMRNIRENLKSGSNAL